MRARVPCSCIVYFVFSFCGLRSPQTHLSSTSWESTISESHPQTIGRLSAAAGMGAGPVTSPCPHHSPACQSQLPFFHLISGALPALPRGTQIRFLLRILRFLPKVPTPFMPTGTFQYSQWDVAILAMEKRTRTLTRRMLLRPAGSSTRGRLRITEWTVL